MESIPKFLNGVFAFVGAGLDKPALLDPSLTFVVPDDRRAQLVYLRAGNSVDDLICLILMRDGKPMRFFPVGAKAGMHIPLTVVEDLEPTTTIEVFIAAPEGAAGHAVIDIGLLQF